MADEGVEGELEQSVRDTPDRDRDPSAPALTKLRADCSHAGVEDGARPRGTGQSVTVFYETMCTFDNCFEIISVWCVFLAR